MTGEGNKFFIIILIDAENMHLSGDINELLFMLKGI